MAVDIETIGVGFQTSGLLAGQRELANTERAANRTADAADRTSDRFAALSSSADMAKRAIALLGGAFAVKEFIQAADSMALLDARLKLATGSAEGFVQAQKDVYAIAQANNVGLQETATLYAKLADPIRAAGGTAKETAAIVDAFATSLRVGGASSTEAAAATLQFAQAMASGKLQGDEFRSIAEASPRFMKAVAEGMGIPIGKLKEMSTEGKLSADVVGNALISSLGKLKQEAQSLPDTVGGAFTRLKNDALQALNDINKNSGMTLGISDVIENARKLIPTVRDELAEAFKEVGAWIDHNREGLSEVWDLTKGLVRDVWELVKSVAGVDSGIVQWGLELGLFQTALIGVRYLVAGLQDGVAILGAGLAGLGSLVLQGLMSPMQGFLTMSAKVAGLFNDDLAVQINGIKDTISGVTDAGGQYAQEVYDRFARGETAVARLTKSLGETQTATESAQKSAEAAATSFAKLTGTGGADKGEVKKANAELEKQQKLMSELAGLSGSFYEDWNRLNAMYKAHKLSLDQLTKAQADLLAKQPAMKAAAEDGGKAYHKVQEEMQRYVDSLEKTSAQLLDDARTQREHNDRLGLSKQAVADLDAAKIEMLATDQEAIAVSSELLGWDYRITEQHRAAAAALRDKAAAVRDGAVKEALIDEADTAKKAAESINQSLTDALMRGFESGKSFAENFRDTLKNMFSTLVLRPVIQGVLAPVSGAISSALGGANALGAGGVGGAIGVAQMANNLYGLVSGGMELSGGLGSGFMGSLAGGLNGAGVGSGLTSSLGLTIGNTIADVVGPSIASALSTGLGAIATAMPWVAGAMAVAGIAKAAFGHGEREYTSSTLNGSVSASGFSGTIDNAWKEKGGWFSSDRTGVTPNAVAPAMATALSSAYKALIDSTSTFATVLGLNADSIKTRSQSLSIALGKDEEVNQKAITNFFAGVGDSLAKELLPSISEFTKGTETAAATLQRVATDYLVVDKTLRSIGATFDLVGVNSISARERLIDLSGGVDAFVQQAGSFAQNFLSEAERNSPVLADVTEKMAQLGYSTVDTRDEFKALVLGLDTTTEGGAKTYAALMGLAGAFAQVHPAVDAAAEAAKQNAILNERKSLQDQLDQLTKTQTEMLAKQREAISESNRGLFDQVQAEKARQEAAVASAEAIKKAQDAAAESARQYAEAQKAAVQSLGDALGSIMSDATKAAEALRSFNDSLKTGSLSTLSKESQYQVARSAYLNANDGNRQAAATAFLQASKALNGSKIGYDRDFAMVSNDISTRATQLDDYAAGIPDFFRAVQKMWGVNGSHAGGLESVPFNGYRAELHAEEMVLPAKTAEYVREGVAGKGVDRIVDALAKLEARIASVEKHSKITADRLTFASPNGSSLNVKVLA